MIEYFKTHQPWYRSLEMAKARCTNPNNNRYHRYGGRGIVVDITFIGMGLLWYRDKAYLMECPTIDRIDKDKNYTMTNCRFIERSENSSLGSKGNTVWRGRKHKPESCQKVSVANKGRISWNKGRTTPPEVRAKMSKSHKERMNNEVYTN